MKPRLLKIRASYYDYQTKSKNYFFSDYQHYSPVPYLPLKGYWLQQFGFEIGQKVRVLPGYQHLVLIVDTVEKD